MSNLAERAVLAGLRISTWTGRKFDKKVTQEVADKHQTGTNAGKYHKNLAQNAPTLEAIRSVAGAARNMHNALTLPWTNEGERILPTLGYMHWAEEMRKYRDQIDTLVRQFVDEYEGIKENDKRVLNGLYNEADYPKDIRACFGFDTLVKPFPTAEDFRVHLAEENVREMKRQLTEVVQASVAEAQGEAVKRLYRAVAHMAERLNDPKAVFRDSLTGNVKEILDLLPGFNLTDKQELTDIMRQAKHSLTCYTADELRESGELRRQVGQRANEIVGLMEGVWGKVGEGNGRA